MKLINAEWEKRNLGVSCEELIIEASDPVEEIQNCIKYTLSAHYQVLKVPVARHDLIIQVQKLGFSFIETIFECKHDLHIPNLQGIPGRLVKDTAIVEATTEQIRFISSNIVPGMFVSDRIAVDPKFGLQASANRYIGWVSDLATSGAKFFLITLKDRPVGFYAVNSNDFSCTGVIGGIFSNVTAAGLGLLLNYFQIITAKDLGCSELRASFSSNNIPVFRINLTLQYTISPKHYVFVTHRGI